MQIQHDSLENPLGLAQFDDWERLQRRLLWVYRGSLGPEHSGNSLKAPFSNAWFVERGWARAVVGDSDATARAGQWLLPRPGSRYQEFSQDVILLSIRFIWEWFSGEPLFPLNRHIRLDAPPTGLTETPYALEKLVTGELGNPHVRLPFQEVPLPLQLRIEQHFLSWLMGYSAALADAGQVPMTPRNLHPALQRAMRYIETEPLSELRRESAVAAAAGISPGHLNRLATNQFGASIRELIERRRLNVAHLLLEQPGIAIKEVAWRVGFGSPQNFSTWFRRRTGQAPASVRKKRSIDQ